MKKSYLKKVFVTGLTTFLIYGCGIPNKNLKGLENLFGLEKLVLLNSSKNQVVMFGESHTEYRYDNDFVINLLPKLKEQGFNYFALEIDKNPIDNEFSNKIKSMFVDYTSGKLTIKKIYKFHNSKLTEEEKTCLNNKLRKIIADYAKGKITKNELHPLWIVLIRDNATGIFNLIDAVKKAGMEIICYDANRKEYVSWNNREKIAFNNQKELIFDKHPYAKVIIYCGKSHINEKITSDPSIKSWEKAKGLTSKDEKFRCLGAYLDELTKGKNLTINISRNFKEPISCDISINLKNGKYKFLNSHDLKIYIR